MDTCRKSHRRYYCHYCFTVFHCLGRLYVDIASAAVIQQLEVAYDHTDNGQKNRFNFLILATVTIPASSAGGRIAIEFPVTMFESMLGCSRDRAPISCVLTGLTAETGLGCYLQKGVASIGLNPKVIVTGFTAVSASATVNVALEGIPNPVVSDDHKIVWVRVTTLNVATSGWPGVIIEQRRLENIFTGVSGSAKSYTLAAVVATTGSLGFATETYTVTVTSPLGDNIAANDRLHHSGQ